MKKFSIFTIAPALALLAVGCSSPTAMQSTEYDDMYYSSADKTEYVQPADEAYAQVTEAETQETEEVVTEEGIRNPEYSDISSSVTDNYYGDDDYDYYDGRTYDPRDNWYRPSYSFVDPIWASDVYASSYHHPRSYRYGYADPFYDPFYYDPFYYDPFAYRPYWRSGVSISISYHYGWGNYYSRWSPYYYDRYYNPWYPHYNNYYNNYYGGYYGRQYVYDYPRSSGFRKVQYGPRGERGGVVTGDTQRGERTERGTLTEGSEQRIERARPSRTTERVSRPATTQDAKEAIISRPGREAYRPREEARPARERINRTQEQRQQEPATREVETRTRTREYTPRREYRQEQRSSESRRIEPRRETTRSYEQREVRRSEPTPTRSYEPREVRRSDPAPTRSSSSGNSGSSRGERPSRGN